jgi:hypothetical protein
LEGICEAVDLKSDESGKKFSKFPLASRPSSCYTLSAKTIINAANRFATSVFVLTVVKLPQ